MKGHSDGKSESSCYPTDTRYWVDEATKTLGYLKPETAEQIAKLIEDI